MRASGTVGKYDYGLLTTKLIYVRSLVLYILLTECQMIIAYCKQAIHDTVL